MTYDFTKHYSFPLDEICIPSRYHDLLLEADKLTPGLESKPCKFVIDNMPELEAGNMLVLSGTVGCGKTFAGYLATMMYSAEKSYYHHEARTEDVYGYEKEIPESTGYRKPDNFGMVVGSREVLKNALTPEWDFYPKFPGILMIDDLGYEHFTDKGFGIAEWDYLFDTRYSEQLATIITTNLDTKQLVEKYNRRIYDRLRECATWGQFAEKSLRGKA